MRRERFVGIFYGQDGVEQETMDYLEFIARVTSHIPDKGQVTVTSSGRGFMLVREGRMGFQNDLGFVAGAARKKKFLSL